MLHETIKGQVKESMKAGDQIRLSVVRGIVSALTNELVAKKHRPTDMLPDEDVLAVISRLAKQRQDSIEQFRSGGREDLAAAEESELVLLKTYLPAQMGEDEIRMAVLAKKAELGIEDTSGLGILVGAIMKDLKGNADGSLVRRVAEDSFA